MNEAAWQSRVAKLQDQLEDAIYEKDCNQIFTNDLQELYNKKQEEINAAKNLLGSANHIMMAAHLDFFKWQKSFQIWKEKNK